MRLGATRADPLEAAHAFAGDFRERYGEVCPDWAEVGWQDATQAAARQFKFLLVYLHSPDHPVLPPHPAHRPLPAPRAAAVSMMQ